MQTLTWSSVYRLVACVARRRPRGSRRVPDRIIVLTLLYAAFCHKPISWAVRAANWPLWSLRWCGRLPSSSTMSRRLRAPSVLAFMDDLLQDAQRRLPQGRLLIVDGTKLPVGRHSKDPHAGTLGPRMGFTRGYALHTLLDAAGRLVTFKVAPLTVGETAMATRMVLSLPAQRAWYLLGDAGYESSTLQQACASRGMVMIAPRRKPGTGRGHRPRCPLLERSVLATERPGGLNPFMDELLVQRWIIERFFGNLDSSAYGLGELPSWVRTARRVARWVHAKLIINAVRMDRLMTQRAA